MSRKVRSVKKLFKVFCEGDSEYHYFDGMRQKLNLSISIKPVNMKGGGYRNFLRSLQTDGTANCLAKFIIIDGDRAVAEQGEKKNLKELIEYCIMQNKYRRTPHVLIVSFPDFEYVACLHTPQFRGQSTEQHIIKKLGYSSLDDFKADSKLYNVLNAKGNSYNLMLQALKEKKTFITNKYKINKTMYELTLSTLCDWELFGCKGSNISEYFGILHSF